MIIEFFGLSGSGKSTIAKALAERGDYKLIRIRKKSELIYFNLLSFLKHPISFFRLFFLVLRNSQSSQEFYYKFMNCFLDYNAKTEKAKRYERAILDQGYFQNIASLFLREIDIEELRDYKRMIRRPDILFVFQLDRSSREERQEERGYGNRLGFEEFEKEKFRQVSEANFRFFLKEGKEIFSDLVFIDASREKLEIIEDIRHMVREKYARS